MSDEFRWRIPSPEYLEIVDADGNLSVRISLTSGEVELLKSNVSDAARDFWAAVQESFVPWPSSK